MNIRVFSRRAVKEKGESKPRQHTIDLSQMAVPLQLAQEKKPSPESPRPSTSEAEPGAEYVAAGTQTLCRVEMRPSRGTMFPHSVVVHLVSR